MVCQILLSLCTDIFIQPSIKWSCIFEIPHRIELVRQYCLFNQPIAEKPKSDATHPWTSRPPQPFLLSSGCCALQQEVTGKWFYSTGIPVPQMVESSFRPPPICRETYYISTQTHRLPRPAMAVSVLLQFRQVHSLGGWCAPDSSHAHP